MTTSVDLYTFLKMHQNGVIRNVKVYGKIVKVLDRPETLQESVKVDDNLTCVQVDMLAIDLSSEESVLKRYNIDNPLNTFFVNGSMATYVPSTSIMPDWYCFHGNIALASREKSNIASMFNFNKDNQGNWTIGSTLLTDIVLRGDEEHSFLEQYLNESVLNGRIIVPDSVRTYTPLYAEKPSIVEQSNVFGTAFSDISKQAQDMQSAPRTVTESPSKITTQNSFIQDRDKCLDFSPVYAPLEKISKDAEVKKDEYITNLANQYHFQDDVDEHIKYMFMNIKKYFKNKPTNFSVTGRNLIKSYLSNFDSMQKSYIGGTIEDYILQNISEVLDYSLGITNVSADRSALKAIHEAFDEPELVYAGILARIIGVSAQTLMSTVDECREFGMSFARMVNTNPYALMLVSSLGINDVKKIAICLGFGTPKGDDIKLRNIGFLYDYTSNSANSSNTIFLKDNLYRDKIGFSVTAKQYESIKSTGTFLTNAQMDNLRSFVNGNLSSVDWDLRGTRFTKVRMNYVEVMSTSDLNNAVDDFVKSGLGVTFELQGKTYITSTTYLNKELFVYKKLWDLAQTDSGYSQEAIDNVIAEFEKRKGFKLEEQQRKAVHLVNKGVAVLTGPAGSGKTTTAECIVEAIITLGGANTKIQFACPTGKAAKRLQEVVGYKVKTMHSLFKLGIGDKNILNDDDDDTSSDSRPDVYIFDENAMATIDLVYSVLKRVKNPKIWFLGDISQLPPIGKGLPFKNMLRFLPCVRLLVSKRSAEGSGITYNSQAINEFSEGYSIRPLKNTDDFKIVPCADESITDVTTLICKYHLGTLTPSEEPLLLKYLGIKSLDEMIKIPNLTKDDIQVISPLAKSTYEWGTTVLNRRLQPVFNKVLNPQNKMSFSVNGFMSSFNIGDRVIHTQNTYAFQWYDEWKDGELNKIMGEGVTNGDVGTIVGFLDANECVFSEFIDYDEEELDVKPRKDDSYRGEGYYFIVVKYFDYDTESDYFVLYRAMRDLTNQRDIVFNGEDLSLIQLFYAGTTHKMQGSQNKLIILALGKINFKGFLTRNMIYTMVTRAQTGVYLVGDVSNDSSSQLSIARREVADDGVLTLGEFLV